MKFGVTVRVCRINLTPKHSLFWRRHIATNKILNKDLTAGCAICSYVYMNKLHRTTVNLDKDEYDLLNELCFVYFKKTRQRATMGSMVRTAIKAFSNLEEDKKVVLIKEYLASGGKGA